MVIKHIQPDALIIVELNIQKIAPYSIMVKIIYVHIARQGMKKKQQR